jgi:hypothetical protein
MDFDTTNLLKQAVGSFKAALAALALNALYLEDRC